MSDKLDWALYHAANGFFVFRIEKDGKKPKYKKWQEEATRNASRIKELWSGKDASCNIGAYTSKYKSKALIVVDVDTKAGRDGEASICALDIQGKSLPDTFENITATGGRHLVYSADEPVKQGANVIGSGLDIRSRGGYIVMAGSSIDDREYECNDLEVEPAPVWLFDQLKRATNKASSIEVDTSNIDPKRARERAEKYLERAPLPDSGERNDTAFKVSCELKDCGVTQDVCQELMNEWNGYLDDPIDHTELEIIVGSAYKTGQNKVGAKAAEAIFKATDAEPDAEEKLHPFDEINKEYALVLAGGGHHILWETKDENNQFKLEHLNEQSFHKFHCHRTVEIQTQKGTKQEAMTKLWLNSKKARRYDGIVFSPGKDVAARFYNLWRGFAVEPVTIEDADPEWVIGYESFIEHTFKNVCNGDQLHFDYLMDFAAHMIQKPWQKPGVSITFRGRKGVGKNVWIETLFSLVQPHALVVDNKRYLVGNFNSHMEGRIAVCFDEAYWAGDKSSEGSLKGLITGSSILIERKGIEPYSMANLLRLFFSSNENWVIPATEDERRYFVLDVSSGRRRDTAFFKPLVRRMKAGGNRLFLDHLMKRDISKFDPFTAPETQALTDQKLASLEPFEQWWFNCIFEGELLGSAMTYIDFTQINCSQFRNAFAQYARQHHIRSRLPDDRQVGLILGRVAKSMRKERVRQGQEMDYFYVSKGLDQLRADWDAHLGSKIKWPNLNNLYGELECLM